MLLSSMVGRGVAGGRGGAATVLRPWREGAEEGEGDPVRGRRSDRERQGGAWQPQGDEEAGREVGGGRRVPARGGHAPSCPLAGG